MMSRRMLLPDPAQVLDHAPLEPVIIHQIFHPSSSMNSFSEGTLSLIIAYQKPFLI
jgi:hypothetical protein